jgi:hypothetical protein
MKDRTKSQQEALTEVRRLVGEAKELSGTGDGRLTDHLATWIAGRYAIAVGQLAVETANGPVDWNLLRAVCHDVVDLRRGDHSAESLRIERERLEMERAEQKAELERRFWEWAEENRGKICQSRMSEQEKEEKLRQILGISEPADPTQAEANGGNHELSAATDPHPNQARCR